MGPVPAEVVVATFFNFAPHLVHAAIPEAWEVANPAAWSGARLDAVDAALQRILHDSLDDDDIAEAAALAHTATGGCSAAGRPLYGAHASLAWPEREHLALWQALTLLREFRGDGHVACLTAAGLDGCTAIVLHAASGEVPTSILRATRAWDDDAWKAAEADLTSRGLLDADGSLTEAGQRERQQIEDRTDELAMAPWRHLGQRGCDRLRELVRPMSRAVVASGTFGFGEPD